MSAAGSIDLQLLPTPECMQNVIYFFFYFSGNRYVVETDGLLIKNVVQSDASTYTCRARVLETGSLEERDIKLEVRGRFPHMAKREKKSTYIRKK